MWNLFLDDQWNDETCSDRVKMPANYIPAASVEEAKNLVNSHRCLPESMMLDCDLGDSGGEAIEFAKWLLEMSYQLDNSLLPPPKYSIHSKNIIASNNLRSFLDNWSKASASI